MTTKNPPSSGQKATDFGIAYYSEPSQNRVITIHIQSALHLIRTFSKLTQAKTYLWDGADGPAALENAQLSGLSTESRLTHTVVSSPLPGP